MPWLVKNLPIKPILLVRHPCAVVQSQMHMPLWDQAHRHPKFKIPVFRFDDSYKKHTDILNDIETVEENLAAHWCLNMVDTINHPANNRLWLTVAYESLYANFNNEIKRLFNWIEQPIPDQIDLLNRKPSEHTNPYSIEYITKGNQLHLWKDTLSEDQIQRIMKIVRRFEIRGYTDDIMPNLAIVY